MRKDSIKGNAARHEGKAADAADTAQSACDRLVEEQVRMMEEVARAWCPTLTAMCCGLSRNPSVGPAERLAEAFSGMAVIQLHDDPYELRMPDGGTVMIAEGKSGLTGMYVPGGGGDGRDAIHCATAGRQDGTHRRRHFTMLHEIGHMVQNRDRTLARRVRTQRIMDRHDFEERCCHMFASRCLLPDSLVGRYMAWPFSADDAVALYRHSFASRMAVAYRMAGLMPSPGSVTVRTTDGRVSMVAVSPWGDCVEEDGRWKETEDDVVRSRAQWFEVRCLHDGPQSGGAGNRMGDRPETMQGGGR